MINQSDLTLYLNIYEQNNLRYIPVDYRTKKPSVEWKKYQTQEPTQEEKTKWFLDKETNIAIICGSASGNLVVIDFDDEKALDQFFPGREILKKTFSVKTNRGYHIYLKTKKPIPSRSIPGVIDILGEGKLAIAPPSIHPEGKTYEQVGPNEIINIDDFDEIFWKKANDLGYTKESGINTNLGRITNLPKIQPFCIKKLMQGVEQGSRNNAGLVIALYLKNQKKTIEEIKETLLSWNNRNGTPLAARELDKIVESVSKHTYGIGCSTPLLKDNCASAKGECPFQDMLELIVINTEEVKITKPVVEGDSYIYEVKIMGKVLKLDSKYMLTPAFFKRRWLEEHGKLINISDTKWRELINFWSSIATYQKNTNPNTDQYIADTILEKLSECNVTTDKQLATVQRNYFFTEDNPITALYYPTKGVKDIIDSTKLKTDMARVHNALKDNLVSTSKVIKVGNKSVRFWAFKPDLMDIEWNNRLKEELVDE